MITQSVRLLEPPATHPEFEVSNLSSPILLSLPVVQPGNASKVTCRFWNGSSWSTEGCKPLSASDGMVVAFRRWLDAYSEGEGALWSRVAPTTETPLRRASKEEVLERYLSHVAHCSACSGALRNIRTTMRLAEGGVGSSSPRPWRTRRSRLPAAPPRAVSSRRC